MGNILAKHLPVLGSKIFAVFFKITDICQIVDIKNDLICFFLNLSFWNKNSSKKYILIDYISLHKIPRVEKDIYNFISITWNNFNKWNLS